MAAARTFPSSLLVLALAIGLAVRALNFVIPGRVENTIARLNHGPNGRSPPALVEPHGHDPVHQVVDGRDPIEHALDPFGRQCAALHRLFGTVFHMGTHVELTPPSA